MPFVIVSALVQLSWKRDYRLTMSILVTGKEEDMLLAVIGYFYGRAFFVQGHKMRVDVVHVGSIKW